MCIGIDELVQVGWSVTWMSRWKGRKRKCRIKGKRAGVAAFAITQERQAESALCQDDKNALLSNTSNVNTQRWSVSQNRKCDPAGRGLADSKASVSTPAPRDLRLVVVRFNSPPSLHFCSIFIRIQTKSRAIKFPPTSINTNHNTHSTTHQPHST